MNITSVRVGRGNLVERKRTLLKKFTNAYISIFISDSIGCENLETIRIARAKAEFGLRLKKNRLVKDLLRGNFLLF